MRHTGSRSVSARLGGLSAAGLLAAGAMMATPFGAEGTAPEWRDKPGKYAVLETSEGKIVVQLFEKEAPITVENFVGLATGTKEFTDPVAGSKAKRPYYDGTKFHRVISGFMMQGGDPTGTGTGGPGFTIDDEFVPSLTFAEKGMLAMANTGRPKTGGSQFFITTAPTTWLNGKHTIFGKVVEGQNVVDHICADLGTKSGKPSKDVVLKKVSIENVGAAAPKK